MSVSESFVWLGQSPGAGQRLTAVVKKEGGAALWKAPFMPILRFLDNFSSVIARNTRMRVEKIFKSP